MGFPRGGAGSAGHPLCICAGRLVGALWLHRQGDLLQSIPAASNAALDGLCDSIAQRWQSSAIGIAFRKRVERGGEAEAEPLSSHAAQPTDTERPISQEPR